VSLEERINWLEQSQHKFEKKIDLRSIIVIGCIVILILIVVGIPLFKTPQPASEVSLTSGYEILDMKGDKVTTWIVWKTVQGDLFHVHVLESPEVTPQRMADIRDVIFSNETVVIDGQTYYKGWMGALNSIKTSELFPIPTHFHTMITDTGTGNIVIQLTNAENGDGYSGLTKTIADVSNNEALKSQITIYEVDKLSDDELKIILRHELGHAFGIAYSDNPDDVMHLTVSQDRPYISPCDIETIEALYNGQERSTVICTS
jgi:Matrixin